MTMTLQNSESSFAIMGTLMAATLPLTPSSTWGRLPTTLLHISTVEAWLVSANISVHAVQAQGRGRQDLQCSDFLPPALQA